MKRFYLVFLGILISFGIYSQDLAQKWLPEIQKELIREGIKWDINRSFKITDHYTDQKTNLQYIYFQDYIHDIPIEGSMANLVTKNDQIVNIQTDGCKWTYEYKESELNPVISVSQAVILAVQKSTNKLYLRSWPVLIKEDHNKYEFKKMEGIVDNVLADLVYKSNGSHLTLYWKVAVHESSGDYWINWVNVISGQIEERKNQTHACNIISAHFIESFKPNPYLPLLPALNQYSVVPIPFMAPNDGPQTVITNPADATASPLGWHDDGTTKYLITRGNNAHAFADLDSNEISSGDEPNGGENLVFNAPYNITASLSANKNAGVINQFYMTNVMHDMAYHYGFTEEAGNFQNKNISGKGKGNDAVKSLTQFGAGSSQFRNNANFRSPADGSPGQMRMYIWTTSAAKLLKVTAPATIAGDLETGSAAFGPEVSSLPISAKVVLVKDGSQNPSFGCKTILNKDDIKGKIALVDRGECFFHEKACMAQAAGAIAVIICNYENATIGMAAVSPAPCNVSIPVLSIGSVDCNLIRLNINNVILSLAKPVIVGSAERDAAFDNGIIAHEYGHGISNRLTGGPSSICLQNDENMGEGWSDFFTLITTVKPSDNGTKAVGVATYSVQQELTGRGIRKFPYSTDFSVNPLTYNEILDTDTPHDLGEVWAAMLWDLYWAMTKKYGWDADLYKGTGGNNKAIRLVFEGMKLQPCNPGFADGRDAILRADQLLNNSDNQCLIWEVFANRGLGFSAKQGLVSNRRDGAEAYDMPPFCIPTLKINKDMTALIKAGDTITVNLNISNDQKTDANNLSISDIIPVGCNFIPGSANIPVNQSGASLEFKIIKLGSTEKLNISYKMVSSKTNHSAIKFMDSMETTEFDWDVISNEGAGIWELTDILPKSGKKSWFVPDLAVDNDQSLVYLKSVSLKDIKQPILRFYHKYNTEFVFDGGTIRISIDNGLTWLDPGPKIFRNGYSGPLSFFAIPILNNRGFYGDSKTYIPSFIDLSDYAGKNIKFMFRFGTDSEVSGQGWFIDDLEIFDMVNYNSQACLKADGLSSPICAEALSKGTIVESRLIIPTKDIKTQELNFSISPNPANSLISVSLKLPKPEIIHGYIYSIDGKLLKTFSQFQTSSNVNMNLNIEELNPGMYIINLKSGNYSGQGKFIIQR